MNQQLNKGMIGLGMLVLACGTAHAEIGAGEASVAASPTAFAGASFGSPIAFGADWRDVGIGVYGQTLHKDSSSRGDADAAVVFGLGDSDKYVGLETAVNIVSLTHINGDSFARNGSLNFKLHTNLPGGAAFAVGVADTAKWGTQGFKDTNRASTYAVATKVFSVSDHALVANLGLGDEGFQTTTAAPIPGNPNNRVVKSGANVFGSLAYYICKQVSVIVDDNGRFVNAGVSVAPIPGVPAVLTLGAINLGNRQGLHTQFGASLGYGFHI